MPRHLPRAYEAAQHVAELAGGGVHHHMPLVREDVELRSGGMLCQIATTFEGRNAVQRSRHHQRWLLNLRQ